MEGCVRRTSLTTQNNSQCCIFLETEQTSKVVINIVEYWITSQPDEVGRCVSFPIVPLHTDLIPHNLHTAAI